MASACNKTLLGARHLEPELSCRLPVSTLQPTRSTSTRVTASKPLTASSSTAASPFTSYRSIKTSRVSWDTFWAAGAFRQFSPPAAGLRSPATLTQAISVISDLLVPKNLAQAHRHSSVPPQTVYSPGTPDALQPILV